MSPETVRRKRERELPYEKIHLGPSFRLYIGKRCLFELGLDMPFGFIEPFHGDFIGQRNTISEVHSFLHDSGDSVPLGLGGDIGLEYQSIRKASFYQINLVCSIYHCIVFIHSDDETLANAV